MFASAPFASLPFASLEVRAALAAGASGQSPVFRRVKFYKAKIFVRVAVVVFGAPPVRTVGARIATSVRVTVIPNKDDEEIVEILEIMGAIL